MSTRGERWAYLEGAAYLLDLRCFLAGRGDAGESVVVSFVAVEVEARDRFAGRGGDTRGGFSSLSIEASP